MLDDDGSSLRKTASELILDCCEMPEARDAMTSARTIASMPPHALFYGQPFG